MPGWLSRLFGRPDRAGDRARGRGHGDAGGVAPFAAVPIGASDSGRKERDGGGDVQSADDSIGSETGSDGGASCGASCGAA